MCVYFCPSLNVGLINIHAVRLLYQCLGNFSSSRALREKATPGMRSPKVSSAPLVSKPCNYHVD